MRSHLKSIAKKKVSDFLLREEGMVGSRTTFATAAFVSTTSLAMFLVSAPKANAGKWCGAPIHGDCLNGQTCCWNGNGAGQGAVYHCTANPDEVNALRQLNWKCW